MKVKKKSLNKYFRDYQLGRLAEEEKQVIDDWFNTHLQSNSGNPVGSEASSSTVEQEIFVRIERAIRKKSGKNKQTILRWLSVACLMMVLGTGAFLARNAAQKQLQQPLFWKSYQTVRGEVKKITLPDGTLIWMNADTKIQLISDFKATGLRKLKLEYGEAFFKVKRDKLRPFSISTGLYVTTVLGTSFNIRCYPEMNSYKVAVASGKVKVDYKNGGTVKRLSKGLTKDQVLNVDAKSGKTLIFNADVSLMSSWRANRSMYLDGLTLNQIGQELSRQYNIDVNVKSDNNHITRKYSIELRHYDLNTILRQLVLKTGMNYQLTDKLLTLNTSR
ncbi:transmembrane sensor [Pedobacter sp. UYP24]